MRRAPAAWRNARRFVPSPLSSSPCFYSFVRDSQSALRSPLRISVFNLAGAEGFEPPSPVLETGSLTVELTPLSAGLTHAWLRLWTPTPGRLSLLRFFMRRVLAATLTELRELKTPCSCLLVLRRRVIALLALAALQCHNLTHLFILTDYRKTCFRESSGQRPSFSCSSVPGTEVPGPFHFRS